MGPYVGAAAGTVLGGTTGSPVGPEGTLIGGGGGAATGAAIGAATGPYVGGVLGAGVGAYIGYKICSGGDTVCEKAQPKTAPGPSPSPSPTPFDNDPCYKQYYLETAWCGSTFTDDYHYEQCMENAWRNLWRCKNGLPPKPFFPIK